jgi:cell division transport system permease protein
MRRFPGMLWRQSDLALERDGSGRFLPWIIALMVYLAALAIAGMMALHGTIGRWNESLAATVTIQLPPGDPAQLDAVMAALHATPGVQSARPLDAAANAALLEPWLGPSVAIAELQLPRLIDVRMDTQSRRDRAALAERVAAIVPGARLADDRHWLDRLFATALAFELIAGAIVVMVGGAMILSIVFATRTSLAIHHGVVEVLHLIGARDGYIASQFQWQALRLALRGGGVGLVLAGLTLLALRQAAGTGAAVALSSTVNALPNFALEPVQWLALLLLAPVAGLTALTTARLTVLRALALMP